MAWKKRHTFCFRIVLKVKRGITNFWPAGLLRGLWPFKDDRLHHLRPSSFENNVSSLGGAQSSPIDSNQMLPSLYPFIFATMRLALVYAGIR